MMAEEQVVTISVANDFSKTPGPRERSEGKHSGEEFLETVLVPRFEQVIAEGLRLRVDLDGCAGYATSFLEAVFGGLARKYGAKDVSEKLEVVSVEEPFLIDEIKKYIEEA